jgi:hypothetical protein
MRDVGIDNVYGYDVARTMPGLTNVCKKLPRRDGGRNDDDEEVMAAVQIGIASHTWQRLSNLFSLV